MLWELELLNIFLTQFQMELICLTVFSLRALPGMDFIFITKECFQLSKKDLNVIFLRLILNAIEIGRASCRERV